MAEAYRLSGWTAKEEYLSLIDIARNAPKPSDRMAATDRLDRRRVRALQAAGSIGQTEDRATIQVIGPTGLPTVLTRTSRAMQIAQQARTSAFEQSALPVARTTPEQHQPSESDIPSLPPIIPEPILGEPD